MKNLSVKVAHNEKAVTTLYRPPVSSDIEPAGKRRRATAYLVPLGLFLFALAWYVCFQIRTPAHSYTYLYVYNTINPYESLGHVGYYYMAALVARMFEWTGLSILDLLCYISIFFGSLAVVCFYFLFLEISKDPFESALACFILLLSGTFWFFSEHGAVYLPKIAFVLMAMLFSVRGRYLISGIFFAVSVSISPSALFVFPGLLYLGSLKQFRWKSMIYLILPSIVGCLIIALWISPSIWRPFRETGESIGKYLHSLSPGDFFTGVLYQTKRAYVKPFGVMLGFAVVGLASFYMEYKKKFYHVLLLALPSFLYSLNLGWLCGQYHLVISLLVSCFAAHGLCTTLKATSTRCTVKWMIIPILIFMHGYFSYAFTVGPERTAGQELSRTVAKLEPHFGSGSVLLADHSFGPAFWYLTQGGRGFGKLVGAKGVLETCRRDHSCAGDLGGRFWMDPSYFCGSFNEDLNGERSVAGKRIYFVDHTDQGVRLLTAMAAGEGEALESVCMRGLRECLSRTTGRDVRFEKIVDSPHFPAYSVLLAY